MERSRKTSEEILASNPSKDINTYALKCIINSDIFLMKYDAAVNYSKNLEQLDQKDGHYFLGIVYYNAKNFNLAREELLKAKSLGAKYDNIDGILKSMK